MKWLAIRQICREAPESSIQVVEEDNMWLSEIEKQVHA